MRPSQSQNYYTKEFGCHMCQIFKSGKVSWCLLHFWENQDVDAIKKWFKTEAYTDFSTTHNHFSTKSSV